MRELILNALTQASAITANTRHIELNSLDTGGEYQRYAGSGKRPKSAAQQQREARRAKNIKKRRK